MIELQMNKNKQRFQEANNVTTAGFAVNLLLTAFKLFAGAAGNSSAMVADGMHSLSDLATDITVLITVRIAGRDSDRTHRYGHGKFETFGALIVGAALFAVGTGILLSGTHKVLLALSGQQIMRPSAIALVAALISIVTKELLFWYTIRCGEKINSQAVIANAWHHRSDAFSSVCTTLGISGAIFLGNGWAVLDPLAGVLVSLLIIKIAYDLTVPCVRELLENSLPENTEKDIMNAISSVEGVKAFHNLKTRKIGSVFAIEAHIKVDRQLSVEDSHKIATAIEGLLRAKYGADTHVGIHVEPFYG